MEQLTVFPEVNLLHAHGTWHMWNTGCRCVPCRGWSSGRQKRYRKDHPEIVREAQRNFRLRHSECRVCPQCGEVFLASPWEKQVCCSHACGNKYFRPHAGHPQSAFNKQRVSETHRGTGGPTHFNYKNGNTRSRGAENEWWRKAVFPRDGYVCQLCGKRGFRLEAHHILSYAQYPELREVVSNGTTLCYSCHKLTHKHCLVVG